MLKEFTGGSQAQLDDWKARGWELLDAIDIARVVVWLLSDDSRSVFGTNINVGAGLP